MNRLHLSILSTWFLMFCITSRTLAATEYVNINNTTPSAPYSTWTTAATNIQDAVDAAMAGDLVLVSNGVYQTGGTVIYGAISNRIAVTKPLTLLSVNGPGVTVIVGYQVPGITNGPGAVRCVYLTNGAVLSGFTLTNGATLNSGDYMREKSGGGVLCESSAASVSNCVLIGNAAYQHGGGSVDGTLDNCTMTGNVASEGGGSFFGTLNNCILTNNVANLGGAASYGTLNHCTLKSNFASASAGATDSCTLNNCTVSKNSASIHGGGAWGGTLNNCILSDNTAAVLGGGALFATLNNCTVSGNSAFGSGGGAFESTCNNCIVYYNSAPIGTNFDSSSTLNHCCTTPMPANGAGNITSEPQLVSDSRISANSPCHGAGLASYAQGADIDGQTWLNPPSMGCDEFEKEALPELVSVSLNASYTNVSVGFGVRFEALIEGGSSSSGWDFGDGMVVTNQPYAFHVWTSPGDYPVVLRAWNEFSGKGMAVTSLVHVVTQPVHYVALGSGSPIMPYSSWSTAASNIQDAVDAASVPGALILVSNGVYQTGGRVVFGAMSNRVAVTKPLKVLSINGPEVTMILGNQMPYSNNGPASVRCVYLASDAMLSGFKLMDGATLSSGDSFKEMSGGGAWCESMSAVLTNCVLVNNSALFEGGGTYNGTLNNCLISTNKANNGGGTCKSMLNHCMLTGNSAQYNGGGACDGRLDNCILTGNSGTYGGGTCRLESMELNNCLLSGNSAFWRGGGAYEGTLNNCTLVSNDARNSSGGTYSAQLNNCIIYFNTAPTNLNFDSSSLANYCCTVPLPEKGTDNFTNAPLFANQTGGDFHLLANSPCINSGSNPYILDATDLDENLRIKGGTVDAGAYEFQSPVSAISYAWMQGYGLPVDGSADLTDEDGDGVNNWQEWRTGTSPIDSASALKLSISSLTAGQAVLTWTSITNCSYFVERALDLNGAVSFFRLQANLAGGVGVTSYIDTNAPASGSAYYRVGVR